MSQNASFSKSEEAGIQFMPETAEQIYSVGISTGGVAEMRMAQIRPSIYVVATTVDEKGAAFAAERVKESGLDGQIEVKLEDVAEQLPYADGTFDYIYARLVLHYLTKQQLGVALSSLYRVLKDGGKMFAVVRSTECPDAKREGATYDPDTGLTTCVVDEDGKQYGYTRYFHTEQSISDAVSAAGFTVDSVESYDEQLFKDFMRTELSDATDNVIQLEATK